MDGLSQTLQFATLDEDELIRGTLSHASLNACDLEERRAIFFNPLFVDVDQTFSFCFFHAF